MRRYLLQIIIFLVYRLLSLRYRVEVRGLNELHLKKSGTLFLPNHIAETDPIIIGCLLSRKFTLRPLVLAHFYYLRSIRFFMNLSRAIPIPSFAHSANSWKRNQLKKCMNQVKAGLQKGENFLIYPAGRLKIGGSEVIGGSSYIHTILQECPNTQIVLIRTSGLWGSTFSRAITGNSPNLTETLIQSMKIVLKNALFFTPRRKVIVEFEVAKKDFPYKKSRLELNQYLEKWYNNYPNDKGERVQSEPLTLVSFSAFSTKLPSITAQEKQTKEKKILNVPKSIRTDVYRELKKLSLAKEIHDDMHFSKDLGLDSLDIATIYTSLDRRYDVESANFGQLHTVHDLLQLIVKGDTKKCKLNTSNIHHYAWPKERFRPRIHLPKEKTIPHCFLKICDEMAESIACGDNFTKFMTYREMKRGAIILARKFMQLPDKHIAILLPSSVKCYIIILGILLAGKIPVILNWTAGSRFLHFSRNLLGLKTILSSIQFLEKVETLDIENIEDSIILMEDFGMSISFFDKIKGVLLSRKKIQKLISYLKLDHIQENDPAIFLFTSGTESFPKAVPLSHKNILSNQRATLESIRIKNRDIIYGVLPSFHSFGLSVGLLSLLSGTRVFYAPDPTDSHAMAQDCFLRKITLLCCAPTFCQNLFKIATPRQLKSIRLIISGAEKAPPKLFTQAKHLGKEIIEGYGITECSPAVTINRVGQKPKGVGQPLKNVQLCTIHPKTHKKLPDKQQGEICICGPNVFAGYFGKQDSNPFIEIDGKRWYRSGDLGRIDNDGSLILEGRLKRFVKIGGEMISLIALEQELIYFGEKEGLIEKEEKDPQLALLAKEDERPHLILFSTFSISRERANQVFQDAGFPRIVKVHKVKQITKIPTNHMGKVQIQKLNACVD